MGGGWVPPITDRFCKTFLQLSLTHFVSYTKYKNLNCEPSLKKDNKGRQCYRGVPFRFKPLPTCAGFCTPRQWAGSYWQRTWSSSSQGCTSCCTFPISRFYLGTHCVSIDRKSWELFLPFLLSLVAHQPCPFLFSSGVNRVLLQWYTFSFFPFFYGFTNIRGEMWKLSNENLDDNFNRTAAVLNQCVVVQPPILRLLRRDALFLLKCLIEL